MNELFRLLPKLLNEMEDNARVREAVVFATWRNIAGESLVEHAVPFRLHQKKLIVFVTTERWQKYLKDLSGQMIFKLNAALKQAAVTFIEFQVNEEFVENDRERRRGKKFDEKELRRSALKQLSPALRSKADSIKDDALRSQFLMAAGSCLARKEKLTKS